MGVLLGGQVQYRVGRIQVLLPARPVGDPAHPDLAEHRHQRPLMPSLEVAVAHPARVHDLLGPALLHGAQIQMVLQHQALDLAPVNEHPLLQLAVGEPSCLLTRKPPQLRDNQLQRAVKPVRQRQPGLRAQITLSQLPAAGLNRPVRQDFSDPSVKIAR